MTFTSKVYDGSLVSEIMEFVPGNCESLGAEATFFFFRCIQIKNCGYLKPITMVGGSRYKYITETWN